MHRCYYFLNRILIKQCRVHFKNHSYQYNQMVYHRINLTNLYQKLLNKYKEQRVITKELSQIKSKIN